MRDNCTIFLILLGEDQLLGQEVFLGIQTLYLQRSQILSIFVFPLQISKHNKWQKCVRVLTSSARCAVLWLWALCRLVANIIGVGREFQFGRKR